VTRGGIGCLAARQRMLVTATSDTPPGLAAAPSSDRVPGRGCSAQLHRRAWQQCRRESTGRVATVRGAEWYGTPCWPCAPRTRHRRQCLPVGAMFHCCCPCRTRRCGSSRTFGQTRCVRAPRWRHRSFRPEAAAPEDCAGRRAAPVNVSDLRKRMPEVRMPAVNGTPKRVCRLGLIEDARVPVRFRTSPGRNSRYSGGRW